MARARPRLSIDLNLILIEEMHLALCILQAYLTRRKGNKTLVVYDLELTLQWQGRLAGEETDVSHVKKLSMYSRVAVKSEISLLDFTHFLTILRL